MAFVIAGECVSCGNCLKVCRPGAIVEDLLRYWIAPRLCDECADCLDVCPVDCIVKMHEKGSENAGGFSVQSPGDIASGA